MNLCTASESPEYPVGGTGFPSLPPRLSGFCWQPRVVLAALLVLFSSCGEDTLVVLPERDGRCEARPAPTHESIDHTPRVELSPRLRRRFAALKPLPAKDPHLVHLGRVLYFEPLLSRTGTVSCNSCHPLDQFGTTNTAVSIGVDGVRGRRNAPTTYHAYGHFRQFWDARARDLEEQAKGPLSNPAEMDMPDAKVVERLSEISGYSELFEAAFPEEDDPITYENVVAAIAAFEEGLITPSRWDEYLSGNLSALTPEEKSGAQLFANLGCLVCHTGMFLGGSMLEKVGVHEPWPYDRDRGRAEVTGQKADDMVFKVPSLRNVAKTAPYFHDASAATLDEAVRMMARHQLGVELEPEEVRSIVTWLQCLSGELPLEYIKRPKLPEDPRR